jgi:hypothetical protein
MKIATGEIAEDAPETGKEYARKGGRIGGRERAIKLSNKKEWPLRGCRTNLSAPARGQAIAAIPM